MAKKKDDDQPVDITLDITKLDLNQRIELEVLLNADVSRIAKASMEGNPLIDDDGKRIREGERDRAIVYLQLKAHHPDITLEEAGQIPLERFAMSKQVKTDEEE